MLNEERSRASTAWVLALLLTLSGATVLAVDEESTGTAGGVEKWDAACKPGGGDPITIETTYPSTSRVEITWLGCTCFATAEEATTWISTLGQETLAGNLIEVEVPDRKYTMAVDLQPGQEVPVVAYCLTEEQISGYLKELQPREVDMRGNP